ncbi:hypothetical protein V4Y02_23985, partial [Escherichia coli]
RQPKRFIIKVLRNNVRQENKYFYHVVNGSLFIYAVLRIKPCASHMPGRREQERSLWSRQESSVVMKSKESMSSVAGDLQV